MKFFRSKAFLISVLVAVGTTIFLWDSIVSTLFSAYFKSYARTHFGAEIAVEKVQRKKSSWVLKSPSMTFSGGGLNAKQVAISYTPYFWERRIEITVKVIDPLIELNQQTLALWDAIKKLDVESGLINYHVSLEVQNGSAIAEHLPPVFFHLKEDLGLINQCTFCGGFSTANQVEGSYVAQNDQHPVLNIQFSDFDIGAASKWIEHLQPGVLEWTSQGGHIDGSWTIDHDFHLGAGDLKISELTLTSVDNPFTIHIPSLSTVKNGDGTAILLENKGKLQVKADEDFLIDLYHFGGNLQLNKLGEVTGAMEGLASLGDLQPNLHVVFDVDQPHSTDLFQYTVRGPMSALLAQLPQRYEHILENDFAGTDAELRGSCVAIEKGVEFCTNVKLIQNEVLILEDFNVFCRVDPTTSRFIDEGNFNVPKMSLEKIVTPFLFLDKQFKLTGEAYFEGTWNPEKLHVRYRPNGAVLESESLVMDIPEPTELDEQGGRFFPGEHFFDFERNHQFGRLYVDNGFYLEKRTDLLFSNLHTQIVFEGKTLTATQVQTYSQGVYFEGSVCLDYSSPLKKTFDLNLVIEKMDGKVSQFQDILGHFPQPLFLQRLPIEGKIMNARGDNKIALHFITGKCNVEADINGVLVEGQTNGEDSSIRAEQLAFEFAYNHENKTLGLTNIGGLLKLGQPATEKIFRIHGEGLHFKNYLRHEGDFSIALRDDRHEWIKLAGEISPVHNRVKGDQVKITFDPGRSHLQDGQAIHCTCELSDWENVEELDLSFQLNVPGILKELQQGVQCGLVTIPEPFVEQLNEWIEEENTDGQLFVQVGYDRSTSLVNVQGRGKQVQLGKHYFDQVNLEAKKRHHTWMIEQFQFDDFSISADLQKEEEDWKLNFLGVRWGNALLAGLEGTLTPDTRELKARINLFELDIAKALAFPKFKEYMTDKQLSGELKGVGELCFKLTNESPGWNCDVLGNLSARGVSFQDVPIEDATNVSFHLLSNKTIALRNFKTSALGVEWVVEKCCYSPKVGELQLENVAFNYPVETGNLWMDALQTHFPDLMDQSLRETITELKTQGSMEGFFDLAISENVHKLTLRLNDGAYGWKGDSYQVKNFSLQSIPHEKSFLFQTDWEKSLPWINIRTGNGEKGIVILAEENPSIVQETPALVIDWKNAPNKPLSIEKISGQAFGVGAELQRAGDAFRGKLSFQLPTLAPLLKNEHLQAVQKAQLKGGYQFEGEWFVPYHLKNWLQQLTFEGGMTGSGCSLKGYCYDQIQGTCSISPGRFLLNDCHVNDVAFQGYLKELLITFDDDKDVPTKVHLTHLQLDDVMPHLIKKDPNEEPFNKKNLTINQLQVTECNGELGDPESYEGSGFLQFSTKLKKGIESTPFALPAEILSRIGLNSAIMTPVRGMAIFHIGHGRCYISKLKDTYSQGKLSKFYIYASKEASYLDFDGNLHLQVRIKHYNLLFKLSEMLTINVRGTLQKPLYYIQK